jgi:radical SAM-linked protein
LPFRDSAFALPDLLLSGRARSLLLPGTAGCPQSRGVAAAAVPAANATRVDDRRMVRDKFRIRFRKAGDLRLVSHHDLMRCFERMLRRAALPFHSTEGFNPKPRLVFALSLPLGVVGCEEVVELELDEELSPEEIHARLAGQTPIGLDVLTVRRVPPKTTAQVRLLTYRLAVPSDRRGGVPERIAALLAAPECWIERVRSENRRLDLRSSVVDVRLTGDAIEMDLRVTPVGTARPEEVLDQLGLRDLLEAGGVLERSRLVLHDEAPEPTAALVTGGGP